MRYACYYKLIHGPHIESVERIGSPLQDLPAAATQPHVRGDKE